MRKIVNWQFYFSLQLWHLVLKRISTEEMQLLVHPFIQLCEASVGISIKNSKYFPFTIKLISMLNEFTNQFIPLGQQLIHFFVSDDYLNKKTKPMQGAMPDMFVAIRISKDHFGRTEMKDWVFKALIDEITIHFANYSNSPSFPEFSVGLCAVI